MPATLSKRSVVVAGHRTSISLEAIFWEALRELAAAEDKTLNDLVTEIDRQRTGNLSSAIRVHLLQRVRAQHPADAAAPFRFAGATLARHARESGE